MLRTFSHIGSECKKNFGTLILYTKKVSSTPQLPCPSFMRGKGFSFLSFFCIIVLWTFYKTLSLTIMKKLNIQLILVIPLWKISIGWSIVAIPPSAVPCMAVQIADILNLFLFDAKAVFVQPAATNTPSTVPLPCPLRSFMSNTDTVFSRLLKNCVLSFWKTVLS